jgi:hypothetical protein
MPAPICLYKRETLSGGLLITSPLNGRDKQNQSLLIRLLGEYNLVKPFSKSNYRL